eukprot:6738407-Prymnesium_polylepis.1
MTDAEEPPTPIPKVVPVVLGVILCDALSAQPLTGTRATLSNSTHHNIARHTPSRTTDADPLPGAARTGRASTTVTTSRAHCCDANGMWAKARPTKRGTSLWRGATIKPSFPLCLRPSPSEPPAARACTPQTRCSSSRSCRSWCATSCRSASPTRRSLSTRGSSPPRTSSASSCALRSTAG